MAQVLVSQAIDAPPERVFGIVRDLGRRDRILPEGWRVLRPLTERLDGIGSSIEIESRVGPAAVAQMVQIQEIREDEAQLQLVESPPTADNYITTWTVRPQGEGCLVFLHSDFSYGDTISEFFARRRLRKAYGQMLRRLKAEAEGYEAIIQ